MSKVEINKSVMNAVLGYIPKESENTRQEELGEGKHQVQVVELKVTHSRIKWNGEEKSNLPPYSDTTPQIGIMFRNNEGVAWSRINMFGYKRWDQLSKAEQESGNYERLEHHGQVYACKQNKSGQYIRIKDAEKTAGAQSIIDQFIASVGMTGEGKLGDMLDTIAAEKMPLTISVESQGYGDDVYNNVVGYYPAKDGVPAVAEEEPFGE